MSTGRTFRISSLEQAYPVLRTFMLLSAAGEWSATKM
jgi:hypothetical protein